MLMRIVLQFTRHEGFDESVDPFGFKQACSNPTDSSSAIYSIPKLLFGYKGKLIENLPNWRIIQNRQSELLLFHNSGGVVAKASYLPLLNWQLNALDQVDNYLIKLFPRLLSLQRQVALERNQKLQRKSFWFQLRIQRTVIETVTSSSPRSISGVLPSA